MGVIKKSHINNPFTDSIEDVLENIENQEEQHFEPEIRRPRKIKHRSARPHPVGGTHITNAQSGKKKKRVDNSTFLLSLADSEETQELSINDFIQPSVSVFSKLYRIRDNIEMWNEFINCTQNNEEWFLTNIGAPDSEETDNAESSNYDGRYNHPAYVASECFQKIDGDLRYLLKKKHVPMGTLIHLEQELVTFFVNRPDSIYHCHIPNSYDRLMLHALSQYMDLSSLSYDRTGVRWTRVKNKQTEFLLPPILLSAFLESKRKKRHNSGP